MRFEGRRCARAPRPTSTRASCTRSSALRQECAWIARAATSALASRAAGAGSQAALRELDELRALHRTPRSRARASNSSSAVAAWEMTSSRSPTYGGWPVRISHRIAPSAKTSRALVHRLDLAAGLLGRHVGRRAHHRADDGVAAGVLRAHGLDHTLQRSSRARSGARRRRRLGAGPCRRPSRRPAPRRRRRSSRWRA